MSAAQNYDLSVDLGERSYPIFIGEGLLGRADVLEPYVPGNTVMIVTNETIAPLYLAQAQAMLPNKRVDTVILPDGEQFKNLDVLNQIFDALLEKRHNRKTTLVALGGGVIGDMTGFAAAAYQRGVNFIQIPTTLLSQVDSSVGGKTGVNHALGKNMIGAFHQPLAVIADTQSLNTLDDRELAAGIAEVIKYGLLGDAEFFDWLEANMDKLLARDPAALGYAIHRSCENKARIVAADEKEAGQRALLNLGHTFGHAIETQAGYGTWLHGEAVGCGMHMAADLSARLGWIDETAKQRTFALIEQANLPAKPPANMAPADFIEKMAVDKKNVDGALRLILMKAIGSTVVTEDFDKAALNATLNSYCDVA